MSKEIELSIVEHDKIFIAIPNGEIMISRDQQGRVRIAVDNSNLGIYPNGSNSILLKVEK